MPENTKENPAFFTVSDIQKLLKIGRNNAYKLVNLRGFPSITVGNRIIIPSDLFYSWVNENAVIGGVKSGK